MESAANRLQKEAKGYLDSLRGENPVLLPRTVCLTTCTAMTASQMRIAETIDAFYGDAGTKDGVSRSYKQAVEDLDAETIKALDGPYRYARNLDCSCNKLTFRIALPFLNQSLASVPISQTSTNASRSAITNCSTTILCGLKSRSWSRSQIKM